MSFIILFINFIYQKKNVFLGLTLEVIDLWAFKPLLLSPKREKQKLQNSRLVTFGYKLILCVSFQTRRRLRPFRLALSCCDLSAFLIALFLFEYFLFLVAVAYFHFLSFDK